MDDYEVVKVGVAYRYNPDTDEVEAVPLSVSEAATLRLREWRNWIEWKRANPDWLSRALT